MAKSIKRTPARINKKNDSDDLSKLISCLSDDDKQALYRIIKLLLISSGNTPVKTVFVVYEGVIQHYKGHSLGIALPLFTCLLERSLDTLRNGLVADIAFYGIEPNGKVLELGGA